jgi:SAM-dependent methyltransferase
MPFSKKDVDFYYKLFPPHVNEHYLKKRLNFLKNFFNNKEKILDIGCGRGKLLRILPECKKFGIDNSKHMIKIAKKNYKDIFFAIANSYELPFKGDSFDFIYSVVVFHHLESINNVQESIEELLKIIKKDREVVIIDHNPNNPYWWLLFKRISWDKNARLVRDAEFLNTLNNPNVCSIKIFRSGFVPNLCPKFFLKTFQNLEKIIEKTFISKYLSAHTVVIIKKIDSEKNR